jgi:hypothetical protein
VYGSFDRLVLTSSGARTPSPFSHFGRTCGFHPKKCTNCTGRLYLYDVSSRLSMQQPAGSFFYRTMMSRAKNKAPFINRIVQERETSRSVDASSKLNSTLQFIATLSSMKIRTCTYGFYYYTRMLQGMTSCCC